MVTYSSLFYRSGKINQANLKVDSKRLKGFSLRKIRLTTKGTFGCLSNIRFVRFSSSYICPKKIGALRIGNSVALVFSKKIGALRIGNSVALVFSKKIGALRIGNSVALVFSKSITNKVYRNFEVYNCWSFPDGMIKNLDSLGNYNCWSFPDGMIKNLDSLGNYNCWSFPDGMIIRVILSGTDNRYSVGFNQDQEYIILDKSDCFQFGLIARSDNSLEEIIAALLLSWQDVGSFRINVVYYRYSLIQEATICWETQSFLINSMLSFPGDRFPSPSSFVI